MKIRTIHEKMGKDPIWSPLEWVDRMVELAEQHGPCTMLIMSPKDLSQYNKAFFSHISFRSKADTDRYMALFQKHARREIPLHASPLVAPNYAISVNEEVPM